MIGQRQLILYFLKFQKITNIIRQNLSIFTLQFLSFDPNRRGDPILPLPWPMAVCVSVSCNTVPFINTFDVFVVAESAESFFHLLTHGEGLEEDRSLASLILSSVAILRSSLFLYFHILYLFEHILGCSQTSGHRSSC